MKNKIKFLIIPIVIVILLFPNSASAGIVPVVDIFKSQLGAIEEFTRVPMEVWVKIFIFYLIGLIAFITSGSLLNWVIKLPLTNPDLISLSNEFVTKGWMFVSGLVNMGIILILLMIAFTYIFKIETFRAKQTFVKLIIVALLINFSLVFVKALFDVSNILYNYILNMVGQNFVLESFKTFAGGIKGVMVAIAGSILILTAPLMFPPAAAWAQFGILVVWLTAGWLFIPTWFMQLAIAYLFSFIFILLFFLLAARIFIIWILAVLSPLAFVCWVLPQTKKFWDQWLKWLLDWMFFGIAILFFLALGLKAIPAIETPWLVWVGGFLPVPGWFFYYFFLFVYLLVVVYLSRKKFMPEFAEFLIEQSKAVGGMIWTMGLKPLGGAMLKQMKRGAAESERVQRLAQRMAMAPTPGAGVPGFRGILTRTTAAPIWALGRAMGGAMGPRLIEAERRDIDAAEKKVAGQRVESQMAAWASARTDKERIGILNAMIKDKNINTAIDRGIISRNELERLYPIAQNRYDKHSVLRSAFPDIAAANLPPGTILPGGTSPLEHVFDQIRPADYDKVSRATLNNDEFIDTVLQRGGGSHVRELIEAHQQRAVQRLEERLQALATAAGLLTPDGTPDVATYLRNRNLKLYKYLRRTPLLGII